jgi:hypothetical protein
MNPKYEKDLRYCDKIRLVFLAGLFPLWLFLGAILQFDDHVDSRRTWAFLLFTAAALPSWILGYKTFYRWEYSIRKCAELEEQNDAMRQHISSKSFSGN